MGCEAYVWVYVLGWGGVVCLMCVLSWLRPLFRLDVVGLGLCLERGAVWSCARAVVDVLSDECEKGVWWMPWR